MEIIGRNIPSFQTAIASVASGIQESTQVKGLAAINSAFETFSAPSFGALGAPESLTSVADVAQFPEPTQYFQANSSVSANPKFDSREFAAVINDKNFSPLNELSRLGENSLFQRGIIVVGGKVPGADMIAWNNEKQKEIERKMKEMQFNQFKQIPLQEGGVSVNQGIKEAAESTNRNSTEAEQSGIIIVGGKVPSADNIDHLSFPPDPIVPHPQPAQLTSTNSGSNAAYAYGPELNGSVKPNEVIQEAMEKGKQPLTQKEPEYVYANGQLPGVNPETFEKLKDFFKSYAEKSGAVLEGRADQTETIKKASEKAGNAGVNKDLLDQFPPIPSLENPLLNLRVQGSTEQNGPVQNAMEKAKPSYTPKEPEYLYPTPQGIKPGGNSPGGVLNEHLSDPKFGEPNPLLNIPLQGSAQQNETVQDATEKAKHPFESGEPEYLDPRHEITKPDGEYMYSQHEIDDFYKKFNPLSPERLDGMMKGELHDSAKQNESIANEMEKAKPSYVPKEPEYLQGDLPPANHSQSTSASDADQRGIIIVGGKSQGTYFETIDDTLAKMNQNPQPETVQLYQQQVGALQDLSATVQQSIQMNQQLTSATLMSRYRV